MSDVMELSEAAELRATHPVIHGGSQADASWCPIMCLIESERAPRRRSAIYIVAIMAHVLAAALLVVQIHRAVHLRAASSVAVKAVSLAAPAAPPAPVEKKIAPHVTQQQDAIKATVASSPLIRRFTKTENSADPDMSVIPMLPSNSENSLFSNLLPSVGSTPKVVGPRRPSGSAREASEAAAPRSEGAPPGSLSGGKITWEGQILAQLAKFRRYPAGSRLRYEEGIVYLRFRMNRAGRVLTSAVERSSGFNALDNEALATLLRAQPLPTIPNDKPDEVELALPIEFFLQ